MLLGKKGGGTPTNVWLRLRSELIFLLSRIRVKISRIPTTTRFRNLDKKRIEVWRHYACMYPVYSRNLANLSESNREYRKRCNRFVPRETMPHLLKRKKTFYVAILLFFLQNLKVPWNVFRSCFSNQQGDIQGNLKAPITHAFRGGSSFFGGFLGWDIG